MLREIITTFMLLIFLAGCSSPAGVDSSPELKTSIHTDVPATDIPRSTSTPFPPQTDTPIPSTWVVIDNWNSVNQIRTMLIDRSGDLWAGGPGGLVHWDLETDTPTIYGIGADPESTNAVALAQTPDDAIWVGTFGHGLVKFDGVTWQSFTIGNGLPGDFILSQTISSSGELWLDIKKLQYDYEQGQEFRFGRFDGNQWTNGVGGGFSWIAGLPSGYFVGAKGDTGIAKHDSVVGIYDGQQWNDVSLPRQTITAMTVAPDGVIWIATLDKIFRYVSRTWHKITTPWAGREFGSVSSIAIAEDGTAWFGFSFDADGSGRCGIRMDYAKEWGVYRYDGKTWTHFTADDGLVDNKICAIALDADGNAWFGSFDKGVSQFDGSYWKTYQIP